MSRIQKFFSCSLHPTKLVQYINRYYIGHFIPEKLIIKCLYKERTGRKLNLDNPLTFNEKLQWLKLYDHNPLYTMMVDKYAAKKYVTDVIGEEYIIPLLGVWNNFDEIDFDALPDQFVLKCTHDSGGIVICRDKSTFDISSAKQKINRCLIRNYYWSGREWPYKNVPRKIIAEKYMENKQLGVNGLIDYKFFCFNGEPKCIYVSSGLEHHPTAQISFVDLDGKRLPFHRRDYLEYVGEIPIPENLALMLQMSAKMARESGCAFLRVDLYEIEGKIYFSEFTFTPCSGMMPIEPCEWDEILGSWIELPKEVYDKNFG